jgi:glutaredoxin 3
MSKDHIIIYTKEQCGYCVLAKNLLKNLGLDYVEKKLTDFASTEALIGDIGKNVKSMPQIKINGELIGGFNQLKEYYIDKGLVNFKGEILND